MMRWVKRVEIVGECDGGLRGQFKHLVGRVRFN